MDSAHAGSLFVHAFESITLNPDMCTSVRLRAGVDARRALDAWERQVRARRALRLALVRRGSRFVWVEHEGADLEKLIDSARVDATRPEAATEPLDIEAPRLPVRPVVTGEDTLVLRHSHVLSNGYGALLVLEDWLGFYGSERATPDLPEADDPNRRGATRPSWLRGLVPTLRWVSALRRDAGEDALLRTVDPTENRAGDRFDAGYGSAHVVLSPDEATRLRTRARSAEVSITGLLCMATAAALLDLDGDSDRVSLLVPADLHAQMPRRRLSDPGNATGGLIVPFERSANLREQAVRGLAPARVAAPYFAARLLDAPVRNEVRLVERLRASARRPFQERTPFDAFSATVTNLGAHPELPRATADLDWVAPHLPSQTLTIASAAVGAATVLGATWPRDLVRDETAERVFASVLDELGLARPSPRADGP